MSRLRVCLVSAVVALLAGAGFAVPLADEPKLPTIEPLDYINRIHIQFSDSQRFGIICPKLRDPRNPDKPKLLTRDERGITNNTVIRTDGYEYLFGVEIPGIRYVKEQGQVIKERPIPDRDKDRSWMSAQEIEFSRLRVTQSMEIIVGEQTRQYDTVLVKYTLLNRDKRPHTVGLRVMLDTYIGANDGVPFYVPPTETKAARLIDKMEIISKKDMPDFVQALETGDLREPAAALAQVGLKVKGHEPVHQLVICRWPQNSEARWGSVQGGPGQWAFEPMDKNPNARDSCVLLYWEEVSMKAEETRELAFTYGLGRVLADVAQDGVVKADGKLRLFVGNRGMVGKPVLLCAYVKPVDPNQKVTLTLPAGLKLADGERAEQVAGKPGSAGYAPVTWRVVGARAGGYAVEVEAAGIGKASEQIILRESSLFE